MESDCDGVLIGFRLNFGLGESKNVLSPAGDCVTLHWLVPRRENWLSFSFGTLTKTEFSFASEIHHVLQVSSVDGKHRTFTFRVNELIN